MVRQATAKPPNHWVTRGGLYVNGHVRVYHGSKTTPPPQYLSRQRPCLRGISDYWVNDGLGRPFFVVEKTVDPGLLEVLRTDIVPRLLREVRKFTETGHHVSLISTAFGVAHTETPNGWSTPLGASWTNAAIPCR